MDATALLSSVAETYASLKSLTVDMVLTTEVLDDELADRNERRARAWFAAPNKIRMEQGGRRGILSAANGADQITYFAGANRYSRATCTANELLPGFFRPEFPFAGGPVFLFSRITENAIAAETLREDRVRAGDVDVDCRVVSVSYALAEPVATMCGSAVVFWIDLRRNLVWQTETEATHRWTERTDTDSMRQTTRFTRVLTNEPIAAELFEFVPPPGAVDQGSERRGARFRTTSGRNSAEAWQSHEWAGDAFVERQELKLRSVELVIQRRFTLAQDGATLKVNERIEAPTDAAEHEFTIAVAPSLTL
jgi:hypothetical protein